MTYFADKAPNKLAENRSALSAPDTSSVAKCSRLTTSGQCTHWPLGCAPFSGLVPINALVFTNIAPRPEWSANRKLSRAASATGLS